MHEQRFFFFYRKPTKQQATEKCEVIPPFSHVSLTPIHPSFSATFLSLFYLQTFFLSWRSSVQPSQTQQLPHYEWQRFYPPAFGSIFWETCSQDVSTVGNSLKLFPIDLYLCSILDISVVFYFLLKLLFLVLSFFSLCWKAVTVHLGHGVGGFWS